MQPVLKQKTSSSLSKKDNVRLNKGPTLNLRGCQFSLFFLFSEELVGALFSIFVGSCHRLMQPPSGAKVGERVMAEGALFRRTGRWSGEAFGANFLRASETDE